jgi:hypothetical protein
MTDDIDKGGAMEEALRVYFRSSGFYVLRGVKLLFEGADASDLDIWLYSRTSAIARHRVVVDVKNKKRAKAMERIFWARGIQESLGLEQAIVATTDRREVVARFGRLYDVVVLDGAFIERLVKSLEKEPVRVTEEELRKKIGAYDLGKFTGDWKARLELSRSLVTSLDYNSINSWLDEARYFLEQVFLVSQHRRTALRLFYILVSLLAIGIDFVSRDLAFIDPSQRRKELDDGFRHGSNRAAGLDNVLNIATGLVEQYVREGKVAAKQIREGLQRDLADIPTSILSEYFSKAGIAQGLFDVARELEDAAYRVNMPLPDQLSSAAQSVILVLMDYWQVDRKRLFNVFDVELPTDSKKAGTERDSVPPPEAARLPLEPASESIRKI